MIIAVSPYNSGNTLPRLCNGNYSKVFKVDEEEE